MPVVGGGHSLTEPGPGCALHEPTRQAGGQRGKGATMRGVGGVVREAESRMGQGCQVPRTSAFTARDEKPQAGSGRGVPGRENSTV